MELLYSSISGKISGARVHVESGDGCTVLAELKDAFRVVRYTAASPRPRPHCPAGSPSPARTAPLLSKQGEIPGTFLHAEHKHRCNTQRLVSGFVYIWDVASSKLESEITAYYHLPARELSFHQSTPS